MQKKMTEEKVRAVIANSLSIADVLKNLEMSITTANYRAFHKAVKVYDLNINHFLGQAHLKNQIRNIKTTIPLNQILVEDSSYLGISQLKKRLIKEGLLTYKCYECGLTKWRNKNISLQLDHINGIHDDHRIENLRLLCPNCHSQTETFCSKNRTTYDPSKKICKCGKPKYKNSKECKSCAGFTREQNKRSGAPGGI